MLTTPRQIILDKDAFLGINLDSLCDFAKSHLLVLSDSLLYECATARKQVPRALLNRYETLIKEGAYYCSCSIAFIQSESKNCLPYPWFLPDLDATEQIRMGAKRPGSLLDLATYGEISSPHYKVARAFLGVSDKLKNEIDAEDPCVGKKIRQLPSDSYERFRILFGFVDSSDLHQPCVDSVRCDWIKKRDKFCLSPEWISWQRVRLTDALVRNYCYLRQSEVRLGEERAEHDYQDMEYVLLLSRADCLLTRDEKLVKPLAKAAFPDKDVFSSLEEVPDSYRCDWVGHGKTV